jgi:IPT/TIG domain
MATDSRPKPIPEPVTEPGRELIGLRRTVVAAALLAAVTLLVLYALVAAWPPAPPAPVAGTVPPTVTSEEETAPTPTPTTEDVTPTTEEPTPPTEEPTPGTDEATPTTGQASPPTYEFLPAQPPPSTVVVLRPAANPAVQAFGAELQVDRETRLFWVVALSGALGGLIHAMRSLFWYAGNRNLKASWLPMYGLLPFVGMALAVVVYVVVRGGLVAVSSQPSSDVVNPFGFAALAGLAGLFSREAAEWLKGVFERVLTRAEAGRDASVQPAITGVDPLRGPVGTEVTITGSGFIDVSEVSFARTAADDWDAESDAEIRATVPTGAREGHVRVMTAGGTARSEQRFLVEEAAEEAEPTPETEPEAPVAGRATGWFRRRGRRRER